MEGQLIWGRGRQRGLEKGKEGRLQSVCIVGEKNKKKQFDKDWKIHWVGQFTDDLNNSVKMQNHNVMSWQQLEWRWCISWDTENLPWDKQSPFSCPVIPKTCLIVHGQKGLLQCLLSPPHTRQEEIKKKRGKRKFPTFHSIFRNHLLSPLFTIPCHKLKISILYLQGNLQNEIWLSDI